MNVEPQQIYVYYTYLYDIKMEFLYFSLNESFEE